MEKQGHMGVEGMMRVMQRVQEAFPQAEIKVRGNYLRDAVVHIAYNANGEASSAVLELVLEEE